MQIEQLRYFQKVAECGSMNKAAKELFCTQPAISSAIKAIEKELGQTILDRNVSGVELTPFGKIVLQDTNLILGYVERWKTISEEQSLEQSITLLLTGTIPPHVFVNFIMKMRKDHPSLDINIKFSPSKKGHIFFASDENFRFGISYRAPAHMRDTVRFAKEHGMRLAILETDDFAIYCNAEDSLAKLDRDPVFDDLRGKEVLLYQDPKLFPYYDKLLETNCKIGPQMWWDETMMLAVAMNKDTVALRPRNISKSNAYINQGQIAVLPPIVDYAMPIYLCFLYPEHDRLTPSELIFLDEFKKFFPQYTVQN